MQNWIFTFLLLTAVSGSSQVPGSITLKEANEWAAANYPLLQKKVLSMAMLQENNQNLQKNYLPQVNLSAQATWQSEVTSLPGRIPGSGFDIEPLSKDQYRLVADINQLVYDGGNIRLQKELNEIKALVQTQEVHVGLQALREKINGIFLRMLLVEEQRKLQHLILSDLEEGLKKVNAQVENGTAFRSNLALLQSEKLQAMQRNDDLLEERQGWAEILSLYTGKAITEKTDLELPDNGQLPIGMIPEERPEWRLYELQDSLTKRQELLIDSRLNPRVSVFANGGYGRPGLNLLENEFAPFVTTGVRFQWNLGGLYTQKSDRKLIDINRQEIQVQKEQFIRNTQSQLLETQATIRKLTKNIRTDETIISLRQQVKESSKAQLDNGVITASDYLREVHAEDQARQNLAVHRLQLLQASIQYRTLLGNED